MRTFVAVLVSILATLAIGVATPSETVATEADGLVCNGCVGNTDIGKNAVTSDKIKNGSIGPADLSADAQPAGVSNRDRETYIPLTGTAKVVRSVTLTAPARGKALVIGGWNFYGDNAAGRCSVGPGTVLDTAHQIVATLGSTVFMPASAFRVFNVKKGKTTFSLVCDATLGAPEVHRANMTALFVPKRY